MVSSASEHDPTAILTADEKKILSDILFGFVGRDPVAGMGEPWIDKMDATHQILRKVHIGAILTLTEDDPYGHLHKAGGFRHSHIPVDDTEPPTAERMHQALLFIESSIKEGRGVAVHCLEGRGRTGTVLCAYIGLKDGLSGDEAIKKIYDLRPCSVITRSQRDFLVEFLSGAGRITPPSSK